MYPVTSAFREAVVACDQRAVVEVTVRLDDSILGTLPVSDGEVTCDGTRDGALRSLSLTVAPDDEAFGWLATAGAEISVARGLDLEGGPELVPLGVFVLDADLEEAADGTITVSAADRSQRISRARWTDPYSVPVGANVGEAIADLVHACWADCPIGETLAGVEKLATAKAMYLDGADSDPWKDARALAATAGYDLYFDGNGELQVRETPDPESAPVCAHYYAGETAVILGRTRTARLSRMYNGVIVTAEGSGVTTPKRGEAWDEDPNSPTYRDGPMGRVPYFYGSPLLTTQSDVDSASQTILARVKRPIEQVSFELVVNPAHEAFDVVEFVDESDVARRYMFDVVSIPLTAGGTMNAIARETEVA